MYFRQRESIVVPNIAYKSGPRWSSGWPRMRDRGSVRTGPGSTAPPPYTPSSRRSNTLEDSPLAHKDIDWTCRIWLSILESPPEATDFRIILAPLIETSVHEWMMLHVMFNVHTHTQLHNTFFPSVKINNPFMTIHLTFIYPVPK